MLGCGFGNEAWTVERSGPSITRAALKSNAALDAAHGYTVIQRQIGPMVGKCTKMMGIFLFSRTAPRPRATHSTVEIL
jgi:hypothetical protein